MSAPRETARHEFADRAESLHQLVTDGVKALALSLTLSLAAAEIISFLEVRSIVGAQFPHRPIEKLRRS